MFDSGTPSESQYPYKASGGSSTKPETPGICSATAAYKLPSGTVSKGYYDVTSDQIKSLIAESPVVTYFWADKNFYNYKSGVFKCSRQAEPNDLNHGVMVYGYDTNGNYFIKNSWGTNWGTGGYATVSGSYDCGIKAQVYHFSNSNFQNVLTQGSCLAYPDSSSNSEDLFGLRFIASIVIVCLGLLMI